MSQITLKYALACDVIRQEITGKLILVGVYGSDIALQSFPAHVGLELLLAIEKNVSGPIEATVELQFMLDGRKVNGATATLSLEAPVGVDIHVATPRIPVAIEQPGLLRIDGKSHDATGWTKLLELPVIPHPGEPIVSSS